MRSPVSLLALVLLASPAAAQGVAICSGDTYVAYVSWDGDGATRASAIELDRPLTEASRRAIPGPEDATELDCELEPRWRSAAGSSDQPARLSRRGERDLVVTCAGIEGVATPSGDFVRGHRIALWPNRLRPTSGRRSNGDRDDSFYVRVSAERDPPGAGRRMRVELRERVTDRVERELLLFDASCPD